MFTENPRAADAARGMLKLTRDYGAEVAVEFFCTRFPKNVTDFCLSPNV